MAADFTLAAVTTIASFFIMALVPLTKLRKVIANQNGIVQAGLFRLKG
jgi:hypothetical protein